MRKELFSFIILILSLITSINGQNLGIGPDTFDPDASAGVEMRFTNKGLLIPRLTLAQRNAIPSPATSLLIYQTDNTPGYYYNAGTPASPNWIRLATTGLDGSGTATRVAFWSGTNTLSSNANLYWDNTNSRLGVGTTSPAYKLDIRDGAHVATSSGTAPFIVSRNYKTTNHEEVRLGVDDSNFNIYYINDESYSKINFRLQNTDTETGGGASASDYTIMTLSANPTEGRVGIGTTSPAQKLHVAGNIRATSLASGANGAIVKTNTSGDMAITNLTGSTGDVLLGNGTFGSITTAGGVTSSCGTANYVPKMNSSTQMSCSQIYDNGSSVGIGITSPNGKLQISGGYTVLDKDYGIVLSTFSTGRNHIWGLTSSYPDAGISYYESSPDYIQIHPYPLTPGGNNGLIVNGDGNVGIGTTSPSAQLHTTGTVRFANYPSSVNGAILKTDGTGNLSITNFSGSAGDVLLGNGTFGPGSAFGDNLGNHTATTNLNMTNHEVDNVTYYDVLSGNGYGIRFWSNDNYKIHMGSGGEWSYGPVTGYSIKMNMNNDATRGWTWGVTGAVPVAALNTQGILQIANAFKIDGNTVIDDGGGWHRSYGNTGWYNGTWGGGIWMDQGTYVRVYNGKGFTVPGNVGIGTTSPSAQLHTTGSVRFAGVGSTSTNTQILTRDASGNLAYRNAGAWAGGSDNVNGSGVATRVAFWSGTNTLSSNANLYWDNTNSRLGVGTSSPGSKLEIRGTADLTLRNDQTLSNSGDDLATINLGDAYSGSQARILVERGAAGSGGDNPTDISFWNTPDGSVTLTERMRIMNDGNVGIGTTSPTKKLQVNGTFGVDIDNNSSSPPHTGYVASTDIAYSRDDISGWTTLHGSGVDDAVSSAQSIGFTFNLFGNDYTTFYVSTNGFIAFGSSPSSSWSNSALPSSSFSMPVICPYWDDMNTRGNGIRTTLLGTSPNRVRIIDFELETYTGAYAVTFQVILHEKSNLISIRYYLVAPDACGQSATIGIQGAGGSTATAVPISCNAKVLDDNYEPHAISFCPVIY